MKLLLASTATIALLPGLAWAQGQTTCPTGQFLRAIGSPPGACQAANIVAGSKAFTKTTSYSVQTTDNSFTFNNIGAVAPVTFTLPELNTNNGLTYCFHNVTGQGLTIQPQADNAIVSGAVIGPNNVPATTTAVDASLCLTGNANAQWVALTAPTGQWLLNSQQIGTGTVTPQNSNNVSFTGGTMQGVSTNLSGGLGPTSNPYALVWPGILGSAGVQYPDWGQYVNDYITAGVATVADGTIVYNRTHPYGAGNTSAAASFSVGSNRPSGTTGYTALGQLASVQLSDAIALTAQADTLGPLGGQSFPGTFTASTFTPTTPFNTVNVTWPPQSGSTQTLQSLMFKNQIVRNDVRPYWRGIVSNPGSGSVVTVFGWVQDGGNGTPGTPPASGNLVIDDVLGWYSGIDWVQGNIVCTGNPCTAPTGTLTNASTTITGVSNFTGIFKDQMISTASGHLLAAFITGINSGAGTITISGAGPSGIGGGGSASETLLIGNARGNQYRNREIDTVGNSNVLPYTPEKITGCTATAGSYQLTGCSSIPTDIRAWLGMLPSDSTKVSSSSIVVTRDSASALTMNIPALANGTTDITFRQSPVEGGVGYDFSAISGANLAASNVRGNYYFGHRVLGAFDTGFIVQPDGTGAVPINAFEVDASIAGSVSGRAFRVGNRRLGTVQASIDPVGNIFGGGTGTFSLLSVPNGSGVGVPASYAANIHATTNANLDVAPGAFFSGVAGGVAVVALQDNGSTTAELALVGSQIDITAQPKLYGQTTGASTQTFTNSPCAALTTERWVPVFLNGVTGTWYIPVCQ